MCAFISLAPCGVSVYASSGLQFCVYRQGPPNWSTCRSLTGLLSSLFLSFWTQVEVHSRQRLRLCPVFSSYFGWQSCNGKRLRKDANTERHLLLVSQHCRIKVNDKQKDIASHCHQYSYTCAGTVEQLPHFYWHHVYYGTLHLQHFINRILTVAINADFWIATITTTSTSLRHMK